MKYKAVLFDLDGTLINTVPDLADAANAMRIDLGMETISNEIIGTYIGKGFENMLQRVLEHDTTNDRADDKAVPTSTFANQEQNYSNGDQASEQAVAADLFKQGLSIFKKHYHALSGNKSKLYPEVIKGLDEFKKLGARLAVVTNKSTEFTPPLLAKMGILDYFEFVVCGDTCPRKKPDPMPLLHTCKLLDITPAQALFIGDSVNDAMAAKAANMDMLVLPYGYNEGQPVQNLPSSGIVDNVYLAAQWASNN